MIPDRVYWFEQTPCSPQPPLAADLTADALVIGGGISGLAAAERLAAAGLDVVLLEAGVCGSGATGRSSGFITPDSELQLADLTRRFGDTSAGGLYAAARSACDHIRETILAHSIQCDYIPSDSLYAALDHRAVSTIQEEHAARVRLGLDSSLLTDHRLRNAISTDRYPAAVRYSGTFGMNGASFAAGFRDALIRRGVRIFEHSAVVRLGSGVAHTSAARVAAPRIIVALDRFALDLGLAIRTLSAARAYLLLSEPLSEANLSRMFPSGPLMVWDTDLIYQYFRPTREGRLLIGGGTLRRTYSASPDGDRVYRKLAAYIARTFPWLRDIRYTHCWHGQIGVTKDILPLAGAASDRPGTWYALGAAGLPWSIVGGWIAAELALGRRADQQTVFDPGRAFTTIDPIQPILGKHLTWMLSYLLARHFETGASAQVVRRQHRLMLGSAAVGVLGATGLLAARALNSRDRS